MTIIANRGSSFEDDVNLDDYDVIENGQIPAKFTCQPHKSLDYHLFLSDPIYDNEVNYDYPIQFRL